MHVFISSEIWKYNEYNDDDDGVVFDDVGDEGVNF